MKKVSIIIPCYNYGKYIEETISSCLNSTYSNFDIIVVNDGSDDLYTLQVLEKLEKFDEKIKVISKLNGGLSSARNYGIKYSDSPYILTLDSDDKIAPTFIEKAIWILENKTNIGYVFSLVQLFGEQEQIWETKATKLEYLKYRNTVPATVVMRRRCWEIVGGYNEEMMSGYEDWEFIIRLEKMKFKGYRLNEILFYYRKHTGSMLSNSKKKHKFIVQSIKNMHPDLYTNHLIDKILYYGYEFKNIMQKKLTNYKRKLESKYINYFKSLYYYFRPIKFEELIYAQKRISTPIKNINININTNINVLIILPWLNVGGVEKVFLNLISTLNPYVNFYIVTTKFQLVHPLENEFITDTSGVYHIGGLNQQDQWEFISYLISNYEISTVHLSNSQKGYELLPQIRKEYPFIQIIDTLHMEEPWNQWDYFRLSKRYSAIIDKRVVLTESQKNALKNLDSKIEKNSIKVIPNGIDFARFNYKYIREKSQVYTVGFVGRMVYQKKPEFFVEIANQLKKGNIPLKFIMIGEGELKDHVLKLVDKYNLNTDFSILPFTNNVDEALNKIDIIICPSILEGFPVLGLEAMAKGVPIIAANVGGWNDLITDNYDGFLLEDNPDEYLKIINCLYYDMELYERIRINAKKTVEKYNFEEMGKSYLTIYKDI